MTSSRLAGVPVHLRTLLFLLLALSSLAARAATQSFEARVVGVADGDTITVLDANNAQHRIRLAGIDAPERGQPFSGRSKQSLRRMVMGRLVRIEWDEHGPLRPARRQGLGDPGRDQLHPGTLPEDAGCRPRPTHRRPRLALPREAARRGGPPGVRVRRDGGPRQAGRALERARPDCSLGLAAWARRRSERRRQTATRPGR